MWFITFLIVSLPPVAQHRQCLFGNRSHNVHNLLNIAPNIAFPPVLDYRLSKSVISPVKDQGACGSCWAFSSAESLEGQMRMNGNIVNVSAQNFVDCVSIDAGCNGGWMDDALAYAEKYGVETDTDYPYTATDQACAYNSSEATIKPVMYYEINKSDDGLRHALLTVGPVSIALDATSKFMEYGPDDYIFNDDTCDTTTPDHALLLVGYNDKEHYWIVKNSWNTDWGRQGYIYINNTLANICGISSFATVPYIHPLSTKEEYNRLKSHVDAVPVDKMLISYLMS
jgi:C1A family cysteine protease